MEAVQMLIQPLKRQITISMLMLTVSMRLWTGTVGVFVLLLTNLL